MSKLIDDLMFELMSDKEYDEYMEFLKKKEFHRLEQRRAISKRYYHRSKEKQSARASAWSKKNKARRNFINHKSKLKKRYGITLEQYNEFKTLQDNRCKICKNKEERLYIDHCHTTNKFRGLLCNKCNFGLGAFNDDPSLVEKAAKYLKDYYK